MPARRLTGLAVVVLMVVGGCRAESVTRVTVQPSGLATVAVEIGFDQDALELIGEEEASPAETLDAFAELLQAGVDASGGRSFVDERYSRGDIRGVRLVADDVAPGDVTELITSGTSVIGDLTIAIGDDQISVTGSTRSITAAERERLAAAAPGDVREVADLRLEVALPGRVESHNGRLRDGVVQWDLMPAIVEDAIVTFSAVAVEVGGAGPEPSVATTSPAAVGEDQSRQDVDGLPLWAVVVPVLIAAGVAAIVARRRN